MDYLYKEMHANVKELTAKKSRHAAGGCIKNNDDNMLLDRVKIDNRREEYVTHKQKLRVFDRRVKDFKEEEKACGIDGVSWKCAA